MDNVGRDDGHAAQYDLLCGEWPSSLFDMLILTIWYQFSLTSPRQYARGRCIHAHLSLDVSDLEELDFFTPDFLSLALTRHQVNYTYAKSGERHERDVKDVVARGRVWPAGGKYRAGQKAFWAQILVPQELAVGFTIPTLSLHVSRSSHLRNLLELHSHQLSYS